MKTFHLPSFPLYWRMTDHPNAARPEGIPARAPFAFTCDPELGLIRQDLSPELDQALECVYRAEANVGYLQVGQSLADAYGQDLWRFIESAFKQYGTPVSALEIGCGGCYILDLLVKAGVHAVGIDPSPIAIKTAADMGFAVVEGFFPHPDTSGPYDLILHSDVLEHVSDPVQFLKNQVKHLTGGGLVIAAVPDCSQSNAMGDLSMIIHQHINYFDRESLAATFRAAGMQPLEIARSGYGGSLYCVGRREVVQEVAPVGGTAGYDMFCSLATSVADRFSREIADAIERGKTVGCYVPLRAFPYLAVANAFDRVRLFDDSAEMAHHYFDGLTQRVENFADLCADPCDVVFVMSYTFGERIKDKLQAALSGRSRIVTLSDLSRD